MQVGNAAYGLHMKKYTAIQEAVERAVVTATLDWEAPTEPIDERCRFDVEALARVIALTKTADGLNAVIAAIDESLTRYLFASTDPRSAEFGCAFAALKLDQLVKKPRGRAYREGPNGLERIA